MSNLDFAALALLVGGRVGQIDVACPLCGPDRRAPGNRTRKVLRLWSDGSFITYNCARCGAVGYATDATAHGERRPARLTAPIPAEVDRSATAATLWDRATGIAGSPAETYLRLRGCFLASPNLRFLAARGDYPPAMIARFGTGRTTGVHITRLRPDGTGKAGTEKDKIMLGPSRGQPIIIHDNPERGELIVTEGIEDAASLALVTGWTAWAAGAASRIASVIEATQHFQIVYVAVDLDLGTKQRAGPNALARAMLVRPDIIPLHIERALGIRQRLDANKALQTYGPEVLLATIEWSEANARLARGEIGFHAMQAQSARAQKIFASLAAAAEEGGSR